MNNFTYDDRHQASERYDISKVTGRIRTPSIVNELSVLSPLLRNRLPRWPSNELETPDRQGVRRVYIMLITGKAMPRRQGNGDINGPIKERGIREKALNK